MTAVWNTVAEWHERRRTLAGRRIGFVPTMGALHAGHASLVERSRNENEITVVSIFVNPSQFNDPKDLDRYPRTLDQDLELLRGLGVDDVIAPNARELYPNGYRLRVEPDSTQFVMEGAHRPGFLQGVLTVVLKLLNIVRPDRAYFGEKDYQQLMAVSEMAEEFFLPTRIIPCPTVREDSGLAMSSRNALLSPEARRKAAHLFESLTTMAGPAEARTALEAHGFAVDYVEERWGRRLAAAFLDGVRLIDNVPIPERCVPPPTLLTPHAQDEVYVIVRGRGYLRHDGRRDAFESGDLLFVAAGVEHRFEDYAEDLAVWVVFYGPQGGEVQT